MDEANLHSATDPDPSAGSFTFGPEAHQPFPATPRRGHFLRGMLFVILTTATLAGTVTVAYASGHHKGYTTGEAVGFTHGKAAGYKQGNADGYATGKTAGYSQGQTDGYAAGDEAGYSQGSAAGYQKGFAAGVGNGGQIGYNQGWADGCNAVFDALGDDTAAAYDELNTGIDPLFVTTVDRFSCLGP